MSKKKPKPTAKLVNARPQHPLETQGGRPNADAKRETVTAA